MIYHGTRIEMGFRADLIDVALIKDGITRIANGNAGLISRQAAKTQRKPIELRVKAINLVGLRRSLVRL